MLEALSATNLAMIFLFIIAGCWLYAMGGRERIFANNQLKGKWLRRYLAPLIFTAGAFLLKTQWEVLLLAPNLWLLFSMGYGSPKGYVRCLKRSLIATMSLAFGAAECYYFGAPPRLLLLHAVMSALTIPLGVIQFFSPPVEEYFICLLLTLPLYFYLL